MSREELIQKMCEAYDYPDGPADYSVCRSDGGKRHRHEMAAALDVAVGELSKAMAEKIRSHYLKPKSDPAVEAAGRVMLAEMDHFGCKNGQVVAEVAAKVVAAVRNADKSLA